MPGHICMKETTEKGRDLPDKIPILYITGDYDKQDKKCQGQELLKRL